MNVYDNHVLHSSTPSSLLCDLYHTSNKLSTLKSNKVSSSLHASHLANADTGTTGHYFAIKDISTLSNVRKAHKHEKIGVTMPNGLTIHNSHIGELNLTALPINARRAYIFPDLQGSLISIGDLCDEGYIAVYTKSKVSILDQNTGNTLLEGFRDNNSRLWMIDLISKKEEILLERGNIGSNRRNESALSDTNLISRDILTIPRANAISQQKLDIAGDRVEFLSRTFGSPAESTLVTALEKGYFHFPGITLRTVKRHRNRLRTPESAAGHLDQARQNPKSHKRTSHAVIMFRS
jgi:hypothetical protein